jgi:hypothetical protein
VGGLEQSSGRTLDTRRHGNNRRLALAPIGNDDEYDNLSLHLTDI